MTIAPPRFSSVSAARLHRRPLVLCLAMSLAAATVPAAATASTVTVTNCADSGAGSLRDAVASAVSGDTIDFSTELGCSTITLTSGAITIETGADGMPLANLWISGPGREALSIDGNYTDRVFTHQAGADGTLQLTNLALHHGFTGGDGGCVFSEGSVDITYAELSECAAGVATFAHAPRGATGARGGAIAAARDLLLSRSFVGDSKVDGGSGPAYGGGLSVGGTALLNRSTVSGNFATSDTGATYGGGISVGRADIDVQGMLNVGESYIQNNSAFSHCGYCPVRGGGAFVYGNAATGLGAISGNSASSDAHYGAGGGLYFKSHFGGATVGAALANTSIGSNSADNDGGAIGAGGDLLIQGTTISGNSARSGGAILQLAGSLWLTDSLLTGNIAQLNGGAISLFGYGDLLIRNSTISENLAQGNGGGIANSYGSVHLENSTVTANTANGNGGGVWFDYPYYTLGLESTIVAGNTAGGDPDDIFAPGGTAEGSHNLIVAAPGLEVPSDTISDDPLLLPLADNGGWTLTHALVAQSPAIDAGANPVDIPFDQRGSGFVRVYASAADIGAFELQPDPTDDTLFVNGFDSR